MKKRNWIWLALPAMALVWLAVGSANAARAADDEVKVIVKDRAEATGRGFLGVVPRRIDHVLRAALNYEDPGVLLDEVVIDGPADKAGLEVGDILSSLNGKPVHDGDRLMSLMKETKPGQEVEVQIVRQGKKKNYKIVLGERPDPKWFGDVQGLEGLRGLEGLKGLQALESLEGLEALKGLDIDVDIDDGFFESMGADGNGFFFHVPSDESPEHSVD